MPTHSSLPVRLKKTTNSTKTLSYCGAPSLTPLPSNIRHATMWPRWTGLKIMFKNCGVGAKEFDGRYIWKRWSLIEARRKAPLSPKCRRRMTHIPDRMYFQSLDFRPPTTIRSLYRPNKIASYSHRYVTVRAASRATPSTMYLYNRAGKTS
jgi:hypothetical protein